MHPPIHPSIHPSITFLPLLKLINRRLASLESHWPLAQSLFLLLGGMGWRSNTLSDKIVVHRLHQLPFLWIRIFYDYQDNGDRNDDKSIKRKWSKIANCCPVTRWCGYDALCKEGKASATNKAQLRRNVSGSLFGDTAVTLPKPSCWRRFNRHWYLLHGSLIYFDGFFCNRVKKRWEKGGVEGRGCQLCLSFG